MDTVEGGLDPEYTATLDALLRLDSGTGLSAAKVAKTLGSGTRRAGLVLSGLRQMGYVDLLEHHDPVRWRLTKEARRMLAKESKRP